MYLNEFLYRSSCGPHRPLRDLEVGRARNLATFCPCTGSRARQPCCLWYRERESRILSCYYVLYFDSYRVGWNEWTQERRSALRGNFMLCNLFNSPDIAASRWINPLHFRLFIFLHEYGFSCPTHWTNELRTQIEEHRGAPRVHTPVLN
jgi:hypothetical protein